MRKVLFILGQLDDVDAEWLVKVGQRETVRAGEVLIEEGRPTDSLYLVLGGQLAARRRGGARNLAELATGEIVGEMSFVDAAPPSASVVAMVDSVVLRVPRAELSKRLAQDPTFGARFYKSLATFLSHRLRTELAKAEGGGQTKDDADEIDPAVLETMTRAGERFDRMLHRLSGR